MNMRDGQSAEHRPLCRTEEAASEENELLRKWEVDSLLTCMQCGFCLPACPTYRETGLETQSPRGRLALMNGVAQANLSIDAEFEQNMYACLGCRACETACPAGVPYGRLLETAREVVEANKKKTEQNSWIREMLFKQVFPYPHRLKALGTLLWVAQATGLQKLASQTGLIRILPQAMAELQQAVDQVASPLARSKRQPVMRAEGKTRYKVGLFTGCVMDVLFYEINQATARVLNRAGCDVVFVAGQACCGALHAHSGEKEGAVALAKRNIEAFAQADVDFIINNAGGCGAALKEYSHWFNDQPGWKERAQAFVSKVRDFNEWLAELPPLPFKKELPVRVTYQDSCHLAHGQKIRHQPRQLIRRIPGVELVEMDGADQCCGSAGIYNMSHYDMSMKILDDKLAEVSKTEATLIVTTNPGCLIQMKQGVIRAGMNGKMEAIHLVELIDRALG